MKALVYEGPKTLAYRDAAEPQPGPGEVVVAVRAVGLCWSDMHAYLGHDERRPAPLILGHESAGLIADGPRAGEPVAVNPLVTCGACPACTAGRTNLCPDRQILSMPPRPGAFAERVAVPERNLVPIPDGVPFEAACLAEPMACGWHMVALCLRALGRPAAATRPLVIGAGAIGYGAALILAAWGAPEVAVAETNPLRHPAVAALPRARLHDGEEGFDVVIDAVGFDATRALAARAVAPGGVIGHIGLGPGSGGLDLRRMTLQEIALVGSYSFTHAEYQAAAAAIFDGRLGPMDWMARRPLSDGAAAFEDVLSGRVANPKVVFTPARD